MLCKKISNVSGNYTIGGIIDINDEANPADKITHAAFLFSKKSDKFYYRLGATVSINQPGIYLYIDNQAKSIMVSPQKQVLFDTGLKGLADMGANIKSENYKIVSRVTGDDQTITLINEHHISCKEYAITFNRHNMRIKRLYMRLTNFNDPLRTDNEKIVDVTISQWNNKADMTKNLSANSVVKSVNGKWMTLNGYKIYRLITM
jgi:hypothetical protein